MALNYPGFVVPQASSTSLLDVIGQWDKGYAQGQDRKYQDQAPGLVADSIRPLQEYGLDPEQIKALIANPNTREMGLAQIREATQRQADANDPMKQLQLKKAQYDVANLGYQAPTAEQRNFQLSQNDPKFAEFIGASGAGKAPAEVQSYLFYRNQAQEAGQQPMDFLAYKTALKGSGLSVTTNPDGTVSVQQGGSAGAMPKLTEGQSKDVVYLTKGAGALPIIDQFGDALTDPIQQVMGVDPTGVVRGKQNPAYQQAEQAGKEFLAAVLRKDTGAAVTKSEEEMYGAMYLPRPGDTPELLDQKKSARARALKAIELGIPSTAIVEMERRGVLPGAGNAQPAAPDGGSPTVGAVDGGYRYLGGDPSKPESWEKVQ